MPRIHRHDVVDSTSERAFAALAAGEAQHLDVHVARGQTAGRGRLGRTWASPVGEGLYASLILLPGPPPLAPAGLTMAAGLAVREALVDLGLEPSPREPWRPAPPTAVRLDWPNDVVVGEAKLAGILGEARGQDPRAPAYVVGIGINVRQRTFPAELVAERRVTSLALLGLDTEPDQVLERLLARFPVRLDQVRSDRARLTEDYLAATGCRGRTVRVRLGDKELHGVLEELSLEKGLSLRMSLGEGRRLPLEHVTALEPIDRPLP
jgi:BirA family biotin operon repressor/biotin-[acetyl-CoA-carboxylase] ligase